MEKRIYKKEKNRALSRLFYLLFIVLYLFAACSSPWDDGHSGETAKITINLGSGTARAGFAEDGLSDGDISFEVDLTPVSEGSIITPVLISSTKAEAEVTPGYWEITLRAFYPANTTNLYAVGSTPTGGVNIIAGINNPVSIPMGRAGGPYTVTFDINGGTGTAPASATGKTTLPNGSGFSKAGFAFSGWNTAGSGGGSNYAAGTSYTPAANITLYAKWVAGPFYSITEFKTWLDAQSTNTAAAAYNVEVIIGDLGGAYNTSGSLGNALTTNSGKYVNLDLSGSNFNAIASNAFDSCATLAGVTIPSSVASIGSSAFSSCIGLTSVTIPDSVSSLGASALRYCSNLASITIGSGVANIESWTFQNCTSLASVTFRRNDNTTIDANASFPGDLINVSGGTAAANRYGTWIRTPPATTWSMGYGDVKYAYTDASATAIKIIGYAGSGGAAVIPSAINGVPVTAIASNAFDGCASITNVSIPSSVTSIGSSAFSSCTGLTSVIIPDSVSSLGASALRYCSNLASITIGSGVANIESWTFQNCTSLASVTFRRNDNTTIDANASFPGDLINVSGGTAAANRYGIWTRTPPATTWTRVGDP